MRRERKKEHKVPKVNKGKNFFGQLKKDSYVLGAIVKKNFKAQYKGSILGVFWTVLNPLLNMLVLSFVFSGLFGGKDGVGNYPIYLLSGTMIFNILRQISSMSLTSIVGNAGIIKKTKVSFAVFPSAHMCTALLNFAFSFISLIVVMLIVGQQFYWTMLMVVLIVPAVTMFSLGIGFFLSSLYTFFRDIKHIYTVALTLWQYLTPIFYTTSIIGVGAATKIINLNPMTVFVTAFRNIVQWGVIPSGIEFLIMYAWAIGALAFGYLVFKLNQRKYILYI